MTKKYKCLVLDHDDTVVDSSASIHYPSFVEYLKIARPHLADKYTLEEYFEKNFTPGILELFTKEIGLSDEELQDEELFWREYVKNHIQFQIHILYTFVNLVIQTHQHQVG